MFNPWKAPNKGNIIIHSISQALQNILSRPSKRKPSHDAPRYKGRILKSTHGTTNWDNHCLHWIIPGEMPEGWNLVSFLMGTFFSVPFLIFFEEEEKKDYVIAGGCQPEYGGSSCPVSFLSFSLLSFPFLSFFKVLSDNFMPGYDAGLWCRVNPTTSIIY